MSGKECRRLALGLSFCLVGFIGLLVVLFGSGCASALKRADAPESVSFCMDGSYALSVDYRLSLDEALRKAGYEGIKDYDVSPFLSQTLTCSPGRSPAWGRQPAIFHLLKVTGNPPISADEAAAMLIHYLDWGTPATLEELLVFSWLYPEVQEQYYVIAAGTSCYLGAKETYDLMPYVYHRNTSSFGRPEHYVGITHADAPMKSKEIRLLIKE